METTININGKDVKITLTAEQVAVIKKSTEKITDRVKTFEDACEVTGIHPDNVLVGVTGNALDTDIKSIQAYAKLIIIARALNEGWVPDWQSSSEYKYVPWFKHKSGFGLSFHGCAYWSTRADVGSRLCYKSKDLAEYAATQFADIYNEYLTI